MLMYGVVWVSLIWMYTTEVRKLDLIKKPVVTADVLE
jgi:NNP family nitrate/nitrite transporter-like MFS transporter